MCTSCDRAPPATPPATHAAQDEAASKPSQREVEKVNPDDARYKRDRHIILPFPALQDMLQRIAAAGRDRTKYIQQRQSKVSYMQLKPGGVLEPA